LNWTCTKTVLYVPPTVNCSFWCKHVLVLAV